MCDRSHDNALALCALRIGTPGNREPAGIAFGYGAAMHPFTSNAAASPAFACNANYGYNALGQFSSVADFNFIGVGPRLDVLTGAYSYDNGARLTGIAYTSSGGATTIDTLGWDYNAGNLATSFTSIDGEADYGYDPTNQLISATYTTAPGGHQPANESESYDLNGNRTDTGYSIGADNLLTSDGTFNYHHDAHSMLCMRHACDVLGGYVRESASAKAPTSSINPAPSDAAASRLITISVDAFACPRREP